MDFGEKIGFLKISILIEIMYGCMVSENTILKGLELRRLFSLAEELVENND